MTKTITIIAIGKDTSKKLNTINDEYLKRTRWHINIIEINPKKSLEALQQKEYEGELILAKLPRDAIVIALDEGGDMPNSLDFAKMLDSAQNITFIIGGAFGLSATVKKSVDKMIAFGRITYPHMIVRMLLIEQIYRAFSILNNHPYHKP